MSGIDVIERELRRQYPVPSANATARARAMVLESATEWSRPARTVARRRWRPVLAAAVAVLALAGTGVAIADGVPIPRQSGSTRAAPTCPIGSPSASPWTA
jgi:hypothetical protein